MNWRGRKKPKDLLELEKQVERFNYDYQVGSPVTAGLGDGKELDTITASNAWIRSDNLVVVMLKGVPGSVQITRITSREEEPS